MDKVFLVLCRHNMFWTTDEKVAKRTVDEENYGAVVPLFPSYSKDGEPERYSKDGEPEKPESSSP